MSGVSGDSLYSVSQFSSDRLRHWNSFVANSSNGTFLFDRNFMDYHKERFKDLSLILDLNEEIVGALPANISGDTVYSHGGLTYGGLVLGRQKSSGGAVLKAMEAIAQFLRRRDVRRLVYKPVPHFYHRQPCESDLYALFRMDAKLMRRDLASAVMPGTVPKFRKGRNAQVQRAKNVENLHIQMSDDWSAFHALLAERLKDKYDVTPVHSCAELALLASRFPKNITLTAALDGGKMTAGCVMFETDRVCHVQYLATDAAARENGAMDFLISQVLQSTVLAGKWFDFGISTVNAGRDLNEGLVAYKESFGAKTVLYDCYELSL